MIRAVTFALLAACGALPNPAPPERPADLPATGPADAAPPPSPTPPPDPATTSTPTTQEKPAPAKPEAEPARPAAPGRVSVARVAGRDIEVSELLRLWLHQDSLQVLETLDHLVLGRLVLAEAARLGVRVDPEVSEKAYREAVSAIETTISKSRPGVGLDRYVDEVLGLDPVRYREFLRDEALRGLLAERVVRAWVLASERTELRVIAVKSEEASREVREALAAGEAFDAVARRLSVDGSAKEGGKVPPVVRGDAPIARLAFDTGVGQVGGPMYEKGAWLFVRVDARPEPLEGDWKAIAPAVEASLAERPIADLEVSQWKPVMVVRYGVDVSPLMRLVE